MGQRCQAQTLASLAATLAHLERGWWWRLAGMCPKTWCSGEEW